MNLRYIFFLFCLLLGSACSDVLVDDLSSEQVQLQAPVDNLETSTQLQTFWWEPLDESIDGYLVKVVTPRFDSVVQLILQVEVVDENVYETTLPPGDYQWTVTAFNSRNETAPMIYNLSITADSTADLNSQNVALLSPEPDHFTNDEVVTFLWQHVTGAQEYRIQVASPDFSNSTFFALDAATDDDFFIATLEEGSYQWRVRGENDNSITAYSSQRFTVDLTPPSAPTLVSPGYGDTLDVPVTLSWEVDPESIFDSLFIYSDSLVSPPIITEELSNTDYLFSDNSSTVYFWRLKSIDEAGNVSAFSALRKFFTN